MAIAKVRSLGIAKFPPFPGIDFSSGLRQFIAEDDNHAAVKEVSRCDFCRVSSSRDQAAAGPALACPLLFNAGPPRVQSASARLRYARGSGA